MCGLTGFLCGRGVRLPRGPRELATGMAARLAHRGPDSAGAWSDDAAGVALGHRRLAIVDLSPEGQQPMVSASGRWVTAYNGEIYNFVELRRELEAIGAVFRGHSDTEVMLAALDRWGLDATLQRLVGMYAIALWDRERRELHLVRDRLGKKPLYLAFCRGALLFGSELKAFHAFPGFAPRIDRDVLTLFLRYAYVPDPYCIYEQALKLPPASLLTVKAHDLVGLDATGLRERIRTYWSLADVAVSGQAAPLDLSDADATEELDRLLRVAVRQRMLADVPLGAFLSGGIDSSAVVALMQAQSDRPVRTFTIGFPLAEYNEATHARDVARHLGTDHTELEVTPDEALSVIPTLPEIYDEPFADQSQVPTYLVSRLARRHVTVALSGDGGDESFGGYTRYTHSARLAAIYRVPHGLRDAASRVLTAVPPPAYNRAFGAFSAAVSGAVSGDRIHKAAEVIAMPDAIAMYGRMVSHWLRPAEAVLGACEPPVLLTSYNWQRHGLRDFTSQMMYLDSVSYLPSDILVKVDRASMAVSLEARCPLLDHRVVEFAWRLPLGQKVRDGKGKWLLRRVLDRYVPSTLFDRPKQGFGIPVNEWLRGPLRDWADDLLAESRLRRDGIFRPGVVRRRWEQQRAGTHSHGYAMWNVLMFQAWHDYWAGSLATEPDLTLVDVAG
jgi:asparagine synthase (glutamine-hydrolysing)